MARIQPEEIVDHLSSEFRRALRDAVQEEYPDLEIDDHALFRAFKREIRRKCSNWELVPKQYVDCS